MSLLKVALHLTSKVSKLTEVVYIHFFSVCEQNAPKPKYQIHMKSTTTPIYVMLVDSDENLSKSGIAAKPSGHELIESAKEDPQTKSVVVIKKEAEVKQSKKVNILTE